MRKPLKDYTKAISVTAGGTVIGFGTGKFLQAIEVDQVLNILGTKYVEPFIFKVNSWIPPFPYPTKTVFDDFLHALIVGRESIVTALAHVSEELGSTFTNEWFLAAIGGLTGLTIGEAILRNNKDRFEKSRVKHNRTSKAYQSKLEAIKDLRYELQENRTLLSKSIDNFVGEPRAGQRYIDHIYKQVKNENLDSDQKEKVRGMIADFSDNYAYAREVPLDQLQTELKEVKLYLESYQKNNLGRLSNEDKKKIALDVFICNYLEKDPELLDESRRTKELEKIYSTNLEQNIDREGIKDNFRYLISRISEYDQEIKNSLKKEGVIAETVSGRLKISDQNENLISGIKQILDKSIL